MTHSICVNKDGSAVQMKKMTCTDQETAMNQDILSIYLSANTMFLAMWALPGDDQDFVGLSWEYYCRASRSVNQRPNKGEMCRES